MRITHSRTEDVRSLNIEVEAHAHWKSFQTNNVGMWTLSKAEAYRKTLEEIFTPYAWPGGCPLTFFLEDDSSLLCNICAKEAFLEERHTVTKEIYYEGPTTYCNQCNKELPSNYGDPWADEGDV